MLQGSAWASGGLAVELDLRSAILDDRRPPAHHCNWKFHWKWHSRMAGLLNSGQEDVKMSVQLRSKVQKQTSKRYVVPVNV